MTPPHIIVLQKLQELEINIIVLQKLKELEINRGEGYGGIGEINPEKEEESAWQLPVQMNPGARWKRDDPEESIRNLRRSSHVPNLRLCGAVLQLQQDH